MFRLIEGSTKRKIQTLEEGNLKERNVVALRELSIEIRSTILTECVKVLEVLPCVLTFARTF